MGHEHRQQQEVQKMTEHQVGDDSGSENTFANHEDTRRFSRAQLLMGLGAGVAMAALPLGVDAQKFPGTMSFPYYPQVPGTYSPENIQDILNMLVTMERFAVAVGTANVSAPPQPGITPLLIAAQQSSMVTNVAHVDFLESLGARSLSETFSVPGSLGLSVASLQRKEGITTIFVGAYMTAAREFAELGQPTLVKWSFQAGAQLAEERATARALAATLGAPTSPPANKAFETDLFLYVRDAYALMNRIGLFGTGPTKLSYPSREQALAAAGPLADKVIQKVPNNATTSIVSPADITKERA